MRSILFLSLCLFGLTAVGQIAHTYNFSSMQPDHSGSYIEKHPLENTYYAGSVKEDDPYTSYNEAEISLVKLNNLGESIWYHKTPVYAYSGKAWFGDITTTTNNIFLTSLVQQSSLATSLLIMKYDHTGNFLDSLYIPVANDYPVGKSELKIDGNGDLVTTTKSEDGDIHYYKINPLTLSVSYHQVIGNSPSFFLFNQRWHCIQVVESSTVVAYNDNDSIRFVVLNASGIVTNTFAIACGSSHMADLEYNAGILCILLNEYHPNSPPEDNPLKMIFTDLSGVVYNTISVPVQHAVQFESIAFDTDHNAYVVSRCQTNGPKYGTIIKLHPSGTMVYEHPLYQSALSEVEIHNNRVIISGNHGDLLHETDHPANGQVFISMKTSEIPDFEVAAPHMHFESNNITCFVASDDQDFSDVADGTLQLFAVNGENTLFMNSLLFAGEDINGQLKSFCNEYAESMNLFAAGPVTNPADYTQVEKDKWQRVWKVSKAEIDAHIDAFSNGDASYVIPDAILFWPGNGDPSKGQTAQVARYVDLNSNGIYEPTQGEYPMIKGDFCALSVYNSANADAGQNYLSSAERAIMQVSEYIYGFECTTDSATQYTLFMHYEIQNLSGSTLYNSHIGNFVDPDIIDVSDDYVSSDPLRSMAYARDADGIGPEQAFVILGSTADADDTDNASGIGPGESPNGYGYGDGIADNERLGMTNFMAYKYEMFYPFMGEPTTQQGFYQYMQSIWQDGTHVTYSGDGYSSGSGIPSNFMFPGNSDDGVWFSTNGIDPGAAWSEETAGNLGSERKMIVSSGPFTFHANDTIHFDVAYVSGTGTNSHENMITYVDDTRTYYQENLLPCGQSFDYYVPYIGTYPYLENEEQSAMIAPTIFPNPTTGQITLQGLPDNSTLSIYSLSGQLISSESVTKNNITYNCADLPAGVYFVHIQNDGYSGVLKFVKQ